MISAEILKKVKGTLKNGDQVIIANRIGFSKPWVNQILNGKTENEDHQRMVIEAAIDIVAKRRSEQKEKDKELLDKVNALLDEVNAFHGVVKALQA